MKLLIVLLGMEVVMFLFVFFIARYRYKKFVLNHVKEFKLPQLASISLLILDRCRMIERFPKVCQHIHQKMIFLYGKKNALAKTRIFLSEMISFIYLALVFFTLLSILASGDSTTLIIGLVITVSVPIIMSKELDKRLKKRQQSIIYELPEFLNKIILLVNAGETLQKAMIRCIEQQDDYEHKPLYIELEKVVNELKLNNSLPHALEEFNQRCSVMEVSIFTTTILLNYRRGGEELVVALRSLSRDLWEKRKSLAKTLGEEASSKLVFPMVLIFVVVLLIVASPAIMIMNQ
jgi:tight adherence protein C